MGDIIGITFENMENAKTNLNKANEDNQNVNTKLLAAISNLQVVCLTSNLTQSQDAIRDQVSKVIKRIQDVDRVITQIDYAVTSFQEVDANYAATIKGKIDEYKQKSNVIGPNSSLGGLVEAGGFVNFNATNLLEMGDFNALNPSSNSSIRQGTGIVMKEGKVEEPSWRNAALEAVFSPDSKIDYLISAAEYGKKKDLITAANDIYHSTISNSSSKKEMYTKMFDEAVIPAQNLKDEAALIGKEGIGSVGTKLGVLGAVVGAGFIIHDDLNNDSYDTVDKRKAVVVDAGQMAATIGSIFIISAGVAAIPIELPALIVIAGGIALGTGINIAAQTAKKEWID